MNTPRTLAIAAAVLAVGALILRDPPTSRRATVDLSALAKEVDKGADHVSAEELRVMVGATKMRLVDIRPPESFAAGHVPGAENVPLATLDSLKVRRDEPVILYSDGGIHSSQAWFLLRARGVTNVRFLLGGYDEWLRVTSGQSAAPKAVAGNAPVEGAPQVPEVGVPTAAIAAPPAPIVPANEIVRKPRRHLERIENVAPPVTPIPAGKVREGC